MYNVDNEIKQGIIAGMLIGLGGYAFILAKYYLNNMLIAALCFPIGLYLICLLGAHLYTGKIGFLFEVINKQEIKLKIVNLVFMLLGNILGAMFIGIVFRLCSTNVDLINTANSVAKIRTLTFNDNLLYDILSVLIKSIMCGILVYLAVYLFKKAKNNIEGAIMIWLPISLFVFCGFDHCIADAFYITAAEEFSYSSLIYILIAIIGNSLGAIGSNGLLNKKKD